MQQAITAEHFAWDEPWPWLEPGGRLGELERRIELAIERGEAPALDAATAAIELLDAIEGDPDAEPVDEREDDRDEACGLYGIDQSEPVGWSAGKRRATLNAERIAAWNAKRLTRPHQPC